MRSWLRMFFHLAKHSGSSLEQRMLLSLQSNAYIQTLLQKDRYADPRLLCHFEHQVFSQSGEDGILAEIFRRIGTTNKQFVEFGVGDGLENNTVYLLWRGWSGWWFDGNKSLIASIGQNLKSAIDRSKLIVDQKMITAENAASILKQHDIPSEIDLFSLDIDRNTYAVWEALSAFRPRVVVIEYNAVIPADVDWQVEYRAQLTWNNTHYFGASAKALELLGKKKGYALVACNLLGNNAFFVRHDLIADKFVGPYTAERHYEPPRWFLLHARSMARRAFDDLNK